jgi:hypothetical protein
LGEVARSAFSPKELAEEEHVHLVERFVGAVQSPSQVAPAARLLATLHLQPAQTGALVTRLSGVLSALNDNDDRSFSFALSNEGGMSARIDELAGLCRRIDVNAAGLNESFRGYVERHLKQERCRDSQAVDLADLAGTAPGKKAGSMAAKQACTSAACQDLLAKYRGLLLDPSGAPLPAGKRSGAEWRARLREFLSALAEWSQDPTDTPVEVFRQKCGFHSTLVNLVPESGDRELVLRSLLACLVSGPRDAARLEWFLPVNGLLARVTSDPLLRPVFLDMRRSDDPVISLYAELEEAAPRAAEQRMSGL